MSESDKDRVSTEVTLIPDERREIIVKNLIKNKVMSVSQLTDLLKCSHMTVRRDINILEQEGKVFSVPGGVRIVSQVYFEPSHHSKSMIDINKKEAIASEAANLISSNMTLYLDAGTTTRCLLPHISTLNNMTVITNDLSIVTELANTSHIEVIQIGGILDHSNLSFVGSIAANTLKTLVVDIAFISTSSWDLRHGVTSPSALKIEVKNSAIGAASKAVLLAASTKYGTFGKYRVTPLETFDLIITDSNLFEDAVTGIRKLGVDLKLA